MAAVITLDRPDIPILLDEVPDIGPDLILRTGTIALDSSYPTNGELLNLEEFLGCDEVVFFAAAPTAGYLFSYEYATDKLKAWIGDFNAVADGVFIEAGNGDNLAALTAVPFEVLVRVALPSEL